MKKIHVIIPIVLASLIFFSCGKPERIPITTVQRQLIPYQKGDTIRFTDEKGNLITMTFTKEISKWLEREEGMSPSLMEEERTILLQSDSGRYSLTLKLLSWDIGANPKTLNFSIESPFENAEGKARYNENSGDFVIDEWRQVEANLDFERYTIFDVLDNVMIGNHTYCNVSFYENASQRNKTKTSYYNKTHGVLQVKKDGKAVFTLQEYIPAR
ncbi:MAG: hypothetical protein NC324_05890 [Bacteroides sp.]|nr:hypothetical protein [Bacteroides sp.]MCM1086485.1 hypothetical protein [Bacteroides sp.]MCM1169451.1 hypothetical protein [Bacteroides sp.]